VIPPLDAFGQAILPRAASHRSVKRLHELLSKLDANAELAARSEQLVALGAWVRARGAPPAPDGAEPGESAPVLKLRLLVTALERFQECAEALSGVLGAVLSECSGLGLLARSGVPADRGFFGETMDRLSRRFLPEAVDPRDLAQIVGRLFPARSDLAWLAAVPPVVLARLVAALAVHAPSGGRPWAELDRAATDALSLIATRVAGVGLFDAIRVRSPRVPLRQSPFFVLPRATDALLDARLTDDQAGSERALAACRTLVVACLETVQGVTQNLERTGVSVDVVYRLELITKNLDRYSAILERFAESDPVARADGHRRLLLRLLEGRRNERNLRQIVRGNVHLLARKIIERAGETGEHYITTTRREWTVMFFSAAGGGVLTAGTAAMKFLISAGHFAPFVEGFLQSTNFAGTFLLMQLLGFTLATKQPSMTAAALAHSMHTSAGQRDLTGLVTMIARITRSQLAAACGNVGAVIPSALALNAFVQYKYGRSFLDAEGADYLIHSLHPTQTGTALFGALTGVLLWLSSVGAGWLENWAVYRRLPEAIAEHRFGRFLGRRTMTWASRAFAHNISGIGGNVTAGFLLGMVPVFGKFFGLPLEVRHITLSTGALTLAACQRGAGVFGDPEFRWAIVGLGVILLMNFGVSFVLALSIALGAREVPWRDRLRMWASVAVTLVRSPAQFFIPPKHAEATEVHGPVTSKPPDVH
jgi:site-specific recombinase